LIARWARQPGNQPHAPAARLHTSASIARSPPAIQYSDSPGYPGLGPVYDLDVHRTADDRAVEALLASVKEPCTAQQLATGLGWKLDRTVDALQRLDESLANTGQILTRLGHHSYTLRACRSELPPSRTGVNQLGTQRNTAKSIACGQISAKRWEQAID
jgi:hypothetical protein